MKYIQKVLACPYDQIGCKFRHEPSRPCKYKSCKNKYSQFKHTENEDAVEDTEDDEEVIIDNQCQFCMKTHDSYDSQNLRCYL